MAGRRTVAKRPPNNNINNNKTALSIIVWCMPADLTPANSSPATLSYSTVPEKNAQQLPTRIVITRIAADAQQLSIVRQTA
jgi:hypothetical protein